MNIILIGARGCGKSTVAPALAAKLGWKSADVDDEIERRASMTVKEIFAAEGEPGFRSREAVVLLDLLKVPQTVVSVGGGTVLAEANREAMRAAGPIVWLKASVESLLKRMQGDQTSDSRRPSLTGHDPEVEVPLLLARREPIYAAIATICVLTDHRTLTDIVAEIMSQVGKG